jgi:hypothetical protein
MEVPAQQSFIGKVGLFIVRGADDVKIAQRFIAGIWTERTSQSAKRTAEKNRTPQKTIDLSHPFHGLIGKTRFEPSTEVLGYSHLVRSADDTNPAFLGKAAQQNPSPSPSSSSQTAEQKAARDKRLAERRAEMAKRAAERQANAAKRIAERKAAFAKRAEELKARNAKRTSDRQATFAKRAAEHKARAEKLKAERQATSAKRAAETQARAAKRSAERQAAAAKRAAAAEKRKALGDGTFRFLSSRMNANFARVVKGAPYSALAVTEYVQKFVDGNQIVRRNEAAYYRDSEGRTRVEQKLNTIGKWSASGEAPRIIMIGDPVSGEYYNLDPRTRTAVKNTGLGKRLEQEKLNQERAAQSGQIKREEKSAATTSVSRVSTDGRRRTENLGSQRIEGVEAQGKRTTTTIPAGEIGNTLPIEITDESWFSPELQTLVMTKHHDPRSGDTIYRLTNVTRREPDRSLFQVPPDYTIVDRSGQKTTSPKTKIEKEKESKSQIFD